MLSTSSSSNVAGNADRVEVTNQPARVAQQRLTALDLGPATRQAPLAIVARAMAATDAGRAARIIFDAERMAQSIPDPNGKGSALAAVAEGLTAIDLNHAERLAQSITTANSRALALAAVAKALTIPGASDAADTPGHPAMR